MDDGVLISAIERYESQSETRGDLLHDREEALKRYLGEPMGNEIDGRSQVVSRDTFDTIEWIKPQIAEIFCGGDQVVMFAPRGPEDVQAAEQETEFVNWVITQKNNWFNVFLNWSHDAYLQKNGYVKAYWDQKEDKAKEKYEGLTDDELMVLLQSIQQTQDTRVIQYGQTEKGHSVTLEKTNSYGCVKLVNIPPENVYVDQGARNVVIDDPTCNFYEYREQKTLSQLRMEGFDVADDLSDSGTSGNDFDAIARDSQANFRLDEDAEEPSMRKVWVREGWIRIDFDEDGTAELRHFIVVGTTVLLNEEADFGLLVSLSPTPQPHQHNGLSLHDAVRDLEEIQTALLRGSLDNVYLANNGRHAIDEDRVNLDDMLVSRPGGVVRVKGGPGDSIMALNHSTTGDVAMPMMEHISRLRAQRTGINEQAQGLDSNTINKNTPYATTSALMSAAQQRIKFIARIFAETGVKELFQKVHALTLKHSRKAEMIQLRNQWVPVDPRQWVKRSDMVISVGLGAGDKANQIMFLDQVLQKQMIAVQAGLSSPPKIYNALKKLTQLGGYKDPNEFWDDPSTKPPMPPPPNPEVEKEQAKAQASMMVEQAKSQSAMQQLQLKNQHEAQLAQIQAMLDRQKQEAELALQAANDQRDAERELLKAQYEAQAEAQKLQFEQWKAATDDATKRFVAELQSATQLEIAHLNGRVTLAGKAADIEQQDKQTQVQAQESDKDRKTQIALQKESAKSKPEPKEDKPEPEKKDDSTGKVLQAIAETQKTLAETLARPKKIVRDANGRAEGIE